MKKILLFLLLTATIILITNTASNDDLPDGASTPNTHIEYL
jgi:hypothetical protein